MSLLDDLGVSLLWKPVTFSEPLKLPSACFKIFKFNFRFGEFSKSSTEIWSLESFNQTRISWLILIGHDEGFPAFLPFPLKSLLSLRPWNLYLLGFSARKNNTHKSPTFHCTWFYFYLYLMNHVPDVLQHKNVNVNKCIKLSCFTKVVKIVKDLHDVPCFLFFFGHPTGLFTCFSGIIGLLKHITSLFISLAELVMQYLITLAC